MSRLRSLAVTAILAAGCSVPEESLKTEAPAQGQGVVQEPVQTGTEVTNVTQPPSAKMAFVLNGVLIRAAAIGDDIYRLEVEPVHPVDAASVGSEETRARGERTTLDWNPGRKRVSLSFVDDRDAIPVWSGTVKEVHAFGRMQQPGLEVAWRAEDDEVLWGLGERFDALNQNGKRVDMWIVDAPGQGDSGRESYYVTPVLYSSKGYALFAADNPEGIFDLDASGSGVHRYRRVGRRMTFYLAAGRTVKELLRKRARVQGPYRGIPDWAWGPWISRNSYETQAEAEAAIQGMLERDIPVAAIVQEAWKGSSETGDFNNFDRDRWPDLEAYLTLCARHDIRNILWQVPILHPSSPHYRVGERQGYFVKRPDGAISHRENWLPGFANIDFTHPEAVQFWQDLLRPVVRLGIYGFKADDGEDIKPDDVFADGRRGWEMHNEYSTLYNRALLDLLDEENVEGLLWARSGSLGIEQSPALWAGDQYATWAQMASLLPAGLSASISGMPFWGHDIGGYIGDPSPELYIRWTQFGAFSPLMQYHGIARREPWVFGEEAVRAYKMLAHLRMNLRPTWMALGEEAARTGVPIMRPMLLEFPGDERFAGEDTQYMLGSDLLVAPVLEAGVSGRRVKFPAGVWQHLLYPVSFKGPSETAVPVGLQNVPVFVREGASLEVELAEEETLGTWQEGAPVRTISYEPERALLRDVRLPVTANPLKRTAVLSYDADSPVKGPVEVLWRLEPSARRGADRFARSGSRMTADIARDDAPRLPGSTQRYVVRAKGADGEPVLLYEGSVDWPTPVTLSAQPRGSRYARSGTREVVTVLRNRTEEPVAALVRASAGPGAHVAPAQQETQLGGGEETALTWRARFSESDAAGDVRIRFALAAGGEPLEDRMVWYARPLHWAVAGPFPTPPKAGYRMAFPPQWNQDPNVSFRTREGIVHWWALDRDHTVRNNGIDFEEAFGPREHAVAYVMGKLRSRGAQEVELRFGSDDTLTVWLNGRQIHSVETYRLAEPDQEVVRARLRAGNNTLVAKVAQDRNPWRMHFRLTGPGGVPVRGVTDGFADIDRYRPDRPVSDDVIEHPGPLQWLAAGPFPFDRSAEWPGGQHDDLAKRPEWLPHAVGVDWKPVPVSPTGVVDLNQIFGKQRYRDAYAITTIEVSQRTPVQFRSGSDDGITVWLNGREILDVKEWRGFEHDAEHVDAMLQPGANRVLCRIRQGTGAWKFKVSCWDISSQPPRPLPSAPLP